MSIRKMENIFSVTMRSTSGLRNASRGVNAEIRYSYKETREGCYGVGVPDL
jgi:hypothetical protein